LREQPLDFVAKTGRIWPEIADLVTAAYDDNRVKRSRSPLTENKTTLRSYYRKERAHELVV